MVDIKATAKRVLWRPISRARAAREFILDFVRYARFSTPTGDSSFATLDADNHECQVTKEYHRIEKGLSLPQPRRPFGAEPSRRLRLLLNHAPSARTDYTSYAAQALSALGAWNSEGSLDVDISPKYEASDRLGPDRARPFFASRRSIRSYDMERPVDPDLLRDAVAMAINSPSVCNRQPWRVRFFNGAEAQEVLKLHNGSAAFASSVPVVGVVTVRTGLFSGAGERNQRWIDGGIFSSTLVWALHAVGFSTCMLNWSRSNSDTDRLRATAGISAEEDVIVLLAVGHAATDARVARSPRRRVESVFSIGGQSLVGANSVQGA